MALPTIQDLRDRLATADPTQLAGLTGSIRGLQRQAASSILPPLPPTSPIVPALPQEPQPGIISSDLAQQTFKGFEQQLVQLEAGRAQEKQQELLDRQSQAVEEERQSKNLLAGREQEIEAGTQSDLESQRQLAAQQQRAAEILFGKAGALFTTTAATQDLATQGRQALLEERQILRNKDRLLGEARQAAADRDIKRLQSLNADIRNINKDAREASEKRFTLGLQLESAKISDANATLSQAQEARLQKESEIRQAETIRDIADKIPVGETYTLPDGTIIRGAKTQKIEDKEYFVSEVKEPDGKVYKVFIDKSDPSKIVSRTFIGQERAVGGGDGGGGIPVRGTQKSGKFSDEILLNRLGQYLNEDGTIDWVELDKVENVNKDLWNDLRITAEEFLSPQEEAEVEEIAGAPERTPFAETKAGKGIKFLASGAKESTLQFKIGTGPSLGEAVRDTKRVSEWLFSP